MHPKSSSEIHRGELLRWLWTDCGEFGFTASKSGVMPAHHPQVDWSEMVGVVFFNDRNDGLLPPALQVSVCLSDLVNCDTFLSARSVRSGRLLSNCPPGT